MIIFSNKTGIYGNYEISQNYILEKFLTRNNMDSLSFLAERKIFTSVIDICAIRVRSKAELLP